jgi:hypothetical protein
VPLLDAGMRWPLAAVLFLAVAGAAGCATRTVVATDVTGLRVMVIWDATLPVDQLVFFGYTAGPGSETAFDTTSRPDPPAAFDSGEASLVILLPDDLVDRVIVVRVDGLWDGEVVAAGAGSTTLVRASVRDMTLTLVAAGACGDDECSTGENRCSCMHDCERICGDGCCSTPDEDTENCSLDC